MSKKLIVFVLVLSMVGVVRAGVVFSDDFDTPHDYVSGGLGAYDGLLNNGLAALDASTSRSGELYMESANSTWDGADTAPLLYIEWTGDFVATVEVTDFAGTLEAPLLHNYAGLMARDPASDGGLENWVSVDYFPTWTAFIAWNNIDDGRSELGQTAGRWEGVDTYALAEQYPYLQLERVGDDFYPRISADGVAWLPLTDPAYEGIYDGSQNPLVINRPDLAGTLQIGLHHATATADIGYVAFDNFTITPEPTTIALLGLGGLGLIRRKRS